MYKIKYSVYKKMEYVSFPEHNSIIKVSEKYNIRNDIYSYLLYGYVFLTGFTAKETKN